MILDSPVRFFGERVSQPPDWVRACVPLVMATTLISTSGVIVAVRGHAVLRDAVLQSEDGTTAAVVPVVVVVGMAIVSAVVGLAVAFWLSTASLIVADVIFATSGRARRLVELSALAYWSQVPWAIVGVFAVALFFHPDPVDLPSSASMLELQQFMGVYQADLQQTPFMLTFRLIGAFFGLWFVALQACALRVVSGFSVGGAWAAGMFLGLVFVVLPWAIQRI